MQDSGKEGHLKVANVEVSAPEDVPVNLLIYVDGTLRSSCSGESNEAFDCGAGRVIKHNEAEDGAGRVIKYDDDRGDDDDGDDDGDKGAEG
jgi:hypothetical protein